MTRAAWEVRTNPQGGYDVILLERNGYRLIGHCETIEAARFLAAGPEMAEALIGYLDKRWPEAKVRAVLAKVGVTG